MSDVVEREIGGLVVRLDRRLCVGFGDCVDEAPAAFEMDDEGLAVFLESAAEEARERVVAACEACPVDALTAIDSEGAVVAP